MFTGQILYIWIAITEYVQSAFSGPPVFSGPDTCSLMKLRNLKMYNSVYKNDFTCISKTYLDYSTPNSQLPKIEKNKFLIFFKIKPHMKNCLIHKHHKLSYDNYGVTFPVNC